MDPPPTFTNLAEYKIVKSRWQMMYWIVTPKGTFHAKLRQFKS